MPRLNYQLNETDKLIEENAKFSIAERKGAWKGKKKNFMRS